VVEGNLLQNRPLIRPQRDPDALKWFRRSGIADLFWPLAADPYQGAINGPDNVRHRDLRRRPGKPESALRAALAAHQARPAQLRQYGLKELPRNVLGPGQLLGRRMRVRAGG
jgi:hypothetical protein